MKVHNTPTRTESTQPERGLPNFVLAGAMKCGTTSLAAYLNAHEQVFLHEREIHYFNLHFAKGTDWYQKVFEDAKPGQIVGDYTPRYLHEPEVPARMADLLPDAKICVILRNPVDMIVSNYWHQRSWKRESRSLEVALRHELETFGRDSYAENQATSYFDRAQFAVQIRRFLEFYDRSQLGVYLLDDMAADREGLLKQVFEFIGIDNPVVPSRLGRKRNVTRQYRSLRLEMKRRKLPAWMSSAIDFVNVTQVQYPQLDSGLRTEIAAAFKPMNEQMARLIGRDLSHWN